MVSLESLLGDLVSKGNYHFIEGYKVEIFEGRVSRSVLNGQLLKDIYSQHIPSLSENPTIRLSGQMFLNESEEYLLHEGNIISLGELSYSSIKFKHFNEYWMERSILKLPWDDDLPSRRVINKLRNVLPVYLKHGDVPQVRDVLAYIELGGNPLSWWGFGEGSYDRMKTVFGKIGVQLPDLK